MLFSSNESAAGLPASVTIAAGITAATFAISASVRQQPVDILARPILRSDWHSSRRLYPVYLITDASRCLYPQATETGSRRSSARIVDADITSKKRLIS